MQTGEPNQPLTRLTRREAVVKFYLIRWRFVIDRSWSQVIQTNFSVSFRSRQGPAWATRDRRACLQRVKDGEYFGLSLAFVGTLDELAARRERMAQLLDAAAA